MKLPLRVLGAAFALLGILLFVCPAQAIAPLAAPANLKASVQSAGGKPVVALVWSPVASATSYVVFRDGKVYGRPASVSFADAGVQFGQKHIYSVCAFQQLTGWWNSRFGPPATATLTVMPPAPTGLTASSLWVPNCPKCHVAMAHIMLAWNAVGGAQSYSVYRGGTLLCTTATAADTDMAVTSGKTYSYTVTAVSGTFVSPQSAPVSATATNPPVAAAPAPDPTTPVSAPTTPATDSMPGFTAPTNLAVNSVWQGGTLDTLTWDAVPGAASYNVYQYGKLIAKGVTATSYTVPLSVYNGAMTYSVTAVDSDCACESIPSAIAGAGDVADPSNVPSWITDTVPAAPTFVTAMPEWNGGTPRIHLTWVGNGQSLVYNIYRDGQKVATGIWGLSWFDNHAQPGESHSYTVSGVYTWWPGGVEGAASSPVTATALTAAPAPVAQKVQIVNVLPDDDSVTVFIKPVPGALDYCVYDVSNPGVVKYAGWAGTGRSSDMIKNGIAALSPPSVISIQWNGITPMTGANLVVQAVDKLGPFQTMDGTLGPGATAMGGGMSVAINGQGDPSNLPNVLAQSDVFHVTCQSQALTGAQAFFDDFADEQPFTPSTPEAAVSALANQNYEIKEMQNDKWRIRQYYTDTQMTQTFVMNNHFMDALYDGPTAANNFSHNNNASMVMIPKATADISGGKVLHATFEVDAHFDARRWCDLFVGQAGDPMLRPVPTKLDGALPTVSGNLFVWQIQTSHDVSLIQPDPSDVTQSVTTDIMQFASFGDQETCDRGIYSQVWNVIPAYANGSPQNLDKRSRFDLYLSQTHYRIVETEPDGVTKITRDHDFPAGVTLPFTNCQVYFVHELYHTGNDRPENLGDTEGAYWVNYRPFCDERHWDDMGQEVLNGFPAN